MTSEAPPFWWEKPDWRVLALSPASAARHHPVGRRMRRAPREKVAAPVLCVGNFTVGGSGKTPVAIALAKQ
ncbi:MAG: tetraacyldisaccharide 4'-kinase, partial [Mesorhizobium sp.]|uniref:tetraacyldisaccharide 4'-kinase n=1 Tax=Mesorhizobium sp. TaxID=1871066 RepID=UPI000FE71873